MDSVEAVEDATSRDTKTPEVLIDDPEDPLSAEEIPQLDASENNTSFVDVTLKDANEQVNANIDVAEIPLPQTDNSKLQSDNHGVAQGDLSKHMAEYQMQEDDDDSKSNESSSEKDDCLPIESDTSNSNMEMPEPESGDMDDSKDDETVETDESVVFDLRKSDNEGEQNSAENIDAIETVSEGNEKITTISDSDESESDSDESAVEIIESESDVEVQTEETKSKNETDAEIIIEENSNSENLAMNRDSTGASNELQQQTEDVLGAQVEVVEKGNDVEETTQSDEKEKAQEEVKETQCDVQETEVKEARNEIEEIRDFLQDTLGQFKEIPDDFEEARNNLQEDIVEVQGIPNEAREIDSTTEELRNDAQGVQDEVCDNVKKTEEGEKDIGNNLVEILEDVGEIHEEMQTDEQGPDEVIEMQSEEIQDLKKPGDVVEEIRDDLVQTDEQSASEVVEMQSEEIQDLKNTDDVVEEIQDDVQTDEQDTNEVVEMQSDVNEMVDKVETIEDNVDSPQIELTEDKIQNEAKEDGNELESDEKSTEPENVANNSEIRTDSDEMQTKSVEAGTEVASDSLEIQNESKLMESHSEAQPESTYIAAGPEKTHETVAFDVKAFESIFAENEVNRDDATVEKRDEVVSENVETVIDTENKLANAETENAKDVPEIGIEAASMESSNSSERELEETRVPAENPDTTAESIFGEKDLEEDNELSQSSANDSISNVDLESTATTSKDDDKSLGETDISLDQSTDNLSSENTAEIEDAIESSEPASINIDQTPDEENDPIFVPVDPENERNTSSTNERTSQETQPQEDPIASDDFAMGQEEELDEQGASEQMCIIPDTGRVISQAEKDAAAEIVPLADPTDSDDLFGDRSDTAGEILTEKKKGSGTENYIISLCGDENVNSCMQCCLPRKSKYSVLHDKQILYVCDDGCLNNFKLRRGDKVIMAAESDLRVKKLASGINSDNMTSKINYQRKCAECLKKLVADESYLAWEIMEFCNELCLSKYQKKVASNCSNCEAVVRNNCLGKYCVRFGYDIRQFCSSVCLEEFKKGLKVCSYCQKDMSSGGGDGFLAPIGDKGQFKDFCTKSCMEKYDVMSNNRRPVRKPGTKCSVCLQEKPITNEFDHNGKTNLFCGEPCFVAFKFVNNIAPGKCNMCKKYFDNKILEEHSMFYDNVLHSFCSKSCQNIYIIGHRKIVPCSWCKVKKYNFDMIKRFTAPSSSLLMCSLNCLSLYQISVNAVHSKKVKCDHCEKILQPLYHLTMSDATLRNFCSYPCVMAFQNQFPKSAIILNDPDEPPAPVPTGGPKRTNRPLSGKESDKVEEVPTIPVISSVQSLATTNGPTTEAGATSSKTTSEATVSAPPQVVKMQIKQQYIIKPAAIPSQRNIGTLCKVNTHTKGVSCRSTMCDKEVQTDEIKAKTALIPIPVPIYVPCPMWMYSMPFPVPFPFPLPIPVPIFIPTTRNSAKGIMKEIKRIQVKIPTDPFEAELLMMAEMVASDKKEERTDSESDAEDTAPPPEVTTFSPEPADPSNSFGDDMLQMALEMATELEEPAVDLEGALTANTITASQASEAPVAAQEPSEEPETIQHVIEHPPSRGRKRLGRPPKTGGTSKRGRRSSTQIEIPAMPPPQPPSHPEPIEKPDANMCLKYTFGVNAWKQWVTTKNAELEKSSRRAKLFKPEILQLSADELNYSLCLFVKEVRKPNGQEYAPDTIYYLCLGIQQYLFENSRIDNIFCDTYYEKFTDCLDEVARKFSVLYNDSHYIVTRVEEEHLWESKQLGAHSPHVLLSTLMFFNTKHFNLTSVEEHTQLSFSHIMKHWKRNTQSGNAKLSSSRNVLLRFYPPQSHTATDTPQRKKKVYEQQENEDNPLRCPVKLYEFYLSKCPESVKTRNDVFYLLPERSCVPDSPVWYSTMALPRTALEKMLHRVKMVKEINVALLTS